jgi:hypothetical protein
MNFETTKRRLKNGFVKLQTSWEENPIAVLAVSAAFMTASAKLIDSISAVQGRRAYARQINHKTKNGRK